MDQNENIVDVQEEEHSEVWEILMLLKSEMEAEREERKAEREHNERKDKRKDRILFSCIALLTAAIITIVGLFVWHISLYDYISYTQEGDGYNNINVQVEGDVNNNNGAESEIQDTQAETE